MELAPSRHADLDLGLTVAKVDAEGDQGEGLAGLGLLGEVSDLMTMDEQLALAIRVVAPEAGTKAPWGDVEAEQPQLMAIDPGIGISDLGLTFAQALDLGALEDHTTFEGLKDVVVVARLAVRRDATISARVLLGVSLRLGAFGLCHIDKGTRGILGKFPSMATL